MIKKIIQSAAIVMLLSIAQYSFAQSKPGCEPKSCGPGNTKVSEAKVITDLRNDLQDIINKMASSNLKFDESIVSMELEKGATDDESVLLIASIVDVIRAELLNKITEQNLLVDLKEYKPVPVLSKQEILANLKKDIQILTEQVKRI